MCKEGFWLNPCHVCDFSCALYVAPFPMWNKESFASMCFSSPVPGSSGPSQDVVAVMEMLKSRKCVAGFPGCDKAGCHIPEPYVYISQILIYILMWLYQDHFLCRHVHGIHCLFVFEKSLATWCCSGVSGCETGSCFAPQWCWHILGPVCPSPCWRLCWRAGIAAVWGDLTGFSICWGAEGSCQPPPGSASLPGTALVPQWVSTCWVGGVQADKVLLPRALICSCTWCLSCNALPAQFPLSLQASGCTDTQIWLLQHVPAELKLMLTQLKLSAISIITQCWSSTWVN